MIDALLYAVRDYIRASKIGYGVAECEIQEDGKPPPRCGNFFAAVHGGRSRTKDGYSERTLYELFDFSVTLTARITVPMDRVGDQLIARNVALVPQAQRQGFDAKVEQLRTFLHMNWMMTVATGQTPNSANDNIAAWCIGTVYGFCKPAAYRGMETIALVGPEWFRTDPGEDPGEEDFGVKTEMRFEGAERFQPHAATVGPFV